MNKKRLLKLADLLEADAKNKKGIKFDISGWGMMDDPETPVSCGTTACAMGLAAISGEFKRAGLDYARDQQFIDFKWNGRRVHGLTAAQRLFEISKTTARFFFLGREKEPGEGAKGERALAKRIRRYVADPDSF